MSKFMPGAYRYNYRSVVERLADRIPKEIIMSIYCPFESHSMNKIYLRLCSCLHSETNAVSVRTGDIVTPISSREALSLYLGGACRPTLMKFLNTAIGLNVMYAIRGSYGREFYIMNPLYAAHSTCKVSAVSPNFAMLSRFAGAIKVEDKYLRMENE